MATRKDCQWIIDRINERDGRPKAGYVRREDGRLEAQVGHLHMDTNSPGDGWTRYRLAIMHERGGISHVGTSRAFRLQEFYSFLTGILVGRGELRPLPNVDQEGAG